MKYLIVANKNKLQHYCDFCDNSYIALYCKTKRNDCSSLPNEFLLDEQLCFIGKGKIPNFNILVVWDRTNLAEIQQNIKIKKYNIVILNELLDFLTYDYIDSFEYSLCIHSVLQRKNYPSTYNFPGVLKREFILPVATTTKDIERPLENNYLQNEVQNGVINTFNQDDLQRLESTFKNGYFIDRLFTSREYYFLQDLKSLYFLSKIRITSFLWEQGIRFLTLSKNDKKIHLLFCKDSENNKVYKSIIYLFDGYELCDICIPTLAKIYNSDMNSTMIKFDEV